MALVPDQKFSTFENGGDLIVGDIIVGLRGGINTKFNYTGELPPGVVVPIANGGTGATTAAQARTNLGLGTMAVQNANAVAITGGSAALASGSVIAAPVAGIDIANKTYVDSEIASAAGGSNGQIQYNNSGGFGGDSGFTTNGAGVLSVTGQLSVDNLRLDGNTLSSTDTNGNINLTPNGTGITTLSSNLQVPNGFSFLSTLAETLLVVTRSTAGPNIGYLQINSTAANGPGMAPLGSPADLSIRIGVKGSGVVNIAGNDTATAPGQVRLFQTYSTMVPVYYVGLSAPTVISAPYTLTYPSAVATTNNAYLAANTSGVMVWNPVQSNQSWSPVPFGSSTAGAPLGTFQGRWDRNGQEVFLRGFISFTDLGGMTGNLKIGSLPFTVIGSSVNRAAVNIAFRDNFINDFVMGGFVDVGATTLSLYNMEIDNTTLKITDIQVGTAFYFTATYLTSDP